MEKDLNRLLYFISEYGYDIEVIELSLDTTYIIQGKKDTKVISLTIRKDNTGRICYKEIPHNFSNINDIINIFESLVNKNKLPKDTWDKILMSFYYEPDIEEIKKYEKI